jgi:hypothetical protein
VSFGLVGGVARLVAGTRPASLVIALALGTPLYLWLLWSSRDRLELTAISAAWWRRAGVREGE